MNLLQKVESGMGCPDWHTAMHSLWLQWLLWISCPGHAGVSGNQRVDRLASTADIASGLRLGRAGCLEAWGTFRTWSGRSITTLITWRKKEWRKEVGDIPPSKIRNNLCSTRQTMALFWEQPWGDCWETGHSTYGPFWCRLKQKLETGISWFVWYDTRVRVEKH